MGLLSGTRGTKKISSLLLALVALSLTLTLWAPVAPGPLGAATAWASGSPDETLNPQPTPKSAPMPTTTYAAASTAPTSTIAAPKLTWKDYLLLAWKYLAVSRF